MKILFNMDAKNNLKSCFWIFACMWNKNSFLKIFHWLAKVCSLYAHKANWRTTVVPHACKNHQFQIVWHPHLKLSKPSLGYTQAKKNFSTCETSMHGAFHGLTLVYWWDCALRFHVFLMLRDVLTNMDGPFFERIIEFLSAPTLFQSWTVKCFWVSVIFKVFL